MPIIPNIYNNAATIAAFAEAPDIDLVLGIFNNKTPQQEKKAVVKPPPLEINVAAKADNPFQPITSFEEFTAVRNTGHPIMRLDANVYLYPWHPVSRTSLEKLIKAEHLQYKKNYIAWCVGWWKTADGKAVPIALYDYRTWSPLALQIGVAEPITGWACVELPVGVKIEW